MQALPVFDPKPASIGVGSKPLHVSIAGDTPKVFAATPASTTPRATSFSSTA